MSQRSKKLIRCYGGKASSSRTLSVTTGSVSTLADCADVDKVTG